MWGWGAGRGGFLLSKEIKVESFGELPVRELPKARRGGNWPRSKAVVAGVCRDQQECDAGGRHTVSVSVPQPGPLHSASLRHSRGASKYSVVVSRSVIHPHLDTACT